MAVALCHVTLPDGVTELFGVSPTVANGINGKITFTPRINDVVSTGGGLGVPVKYDSFVDNGQWVDGDGNPGLWMVRPDSTDRTFVYDARAELSYEDSRNYIKEFHIAVPAAANAILTDLLAVPGPPSTFITKGEQGDKGDTGADSTVPGPAGAPGGSDASTASFITSGALTLPALAASAPIASKVNKGEIIVNVKDHGAVGDGTANDTTAIRAAAAAGTRLYFPPGNYRVETITEGDALITWTGKTGITVDAEQATITCPTVYTGDMLTSVFLLDNCSNATIRLGAFNGIPVADVTTQIGYRGMTFVRAINGTQNVKIDARITNCRYGIQTGAYAIPSQGYCKDFDIRLKCNAVGYPLAAYLAEGMRFDIDADTIHRAVYLAGCIDVRGVVRWKDIYIAPIAVLITDALTSGTDAAAQIDPTGAATASRASQQIDVESIDKGSTVFPANSYAIGLSLSRVDACQYRDINMKFSVTATNTQSTTVQGFLLNSTANSIWSRYPFNWESYVELTNITVSGVLDKSAVTTSTSTQGAFSVRGTDGGHSPAVRGLALTDVVVRSTVAMPDSILWAPGAVTPVSLTRVTLPATLAVNVSATVPTVLTSCDVDIVNALGPAGGSRIVGGGGTRVGGFTNAGQNAAMVGASTRGGGAYVTTLEYSVALAGASVTIAAGIPFGSLVLGVQGRIATAITGADGFQVGIPADITRFANRPGATTVGTTFEPVTSTETMARLYTVTTPIVVTARTASFTGGVLRLLVHYVAFPAMTS